MNNKISDWAFVPTRLKWLQWQGGHINRVAERQASTISGFPDSFWKITQLILSHYVQSDTKDFIHARKSIMHKRELWQDSTISSTVFINNKPFTELSSLTHCGQLILQNQFSGEVKNMSKQSAEKWYTCRNYSPCSSSL